MGKIAIVTGATSGIGEAVAGMLAKEQYDLVITGRRESKLQELAKKLAADYGVKTLALGFDVRSFYVELVHDLKKQGF